MTPINQIKFGQMTAASRRNVMKRNTSSRSVSAEQAHNQRMTTSTFDDAKAVKVQSSQNSSTQSATFAQLTNSMGLLNQFFGSNVKNSSTPDVSVNQTGGNNANTASGIAQGVDASQFTSSAGDYNSISNRIDNNSFNSAELNQYINTEVNPYVSISQSNLANAKADYNVLLGQKDRAATDVSNIEGQIGSAETSYKSAEKSLSSNKSDLDSSTKARDKMDEQLSTVNQEYKTACSNVQQKEGAKSSAQTKVSGCKSAESKAQTELSSATQSYESAEQALANTPETLEDGTPNPQYNAAKTARNSAKEKKEASQTAFDQAKQERETADDELKTAEQDLTAAQDSKKEILQNLSKTDSQHKQLADNCLRLENQVENAQESYDTSLEAYDDSKDNYERLNTELESANGILTQCDQYQSRIATLQTEADKANELKAKADKALQTKDSELEKDLKTEISSEEFENIKKDMLEHANASEGCGYNKTIMENLIASKDYDLSKCTGNLWTPNHNNYYGSRESFKQDGYIENKDGSFTDPRTGVTMINALGDNYTWVSQDYFAGPGDVTELGTKSAAGRDYPGLFDAIDRNKTQYNAKIGLDGFNSNGEPNFRKMKYKMNGGTTYG